jgi:hypothetical protein
MRIALVAATVIATLLGFAVFWSYYSTRHNRNGKSQPRGFEVQQKPDEAEDNAVK